MVILGCDDPPNLLLCDLLGLRVQGSGFRTSGSTFGRKS